MRELLEGLGELLRYPDRSYFGRLDEALRLAAELDCRDALERFRRQTRDLSVSQLQELYIQTFELSPLCSLEVGWQLYGEDYARGSFLVYMRTQLQAHRIEERGELPDHLVHVLPAMAQMPTEKADELRTGAVLPALKKMLAAFEGKTNPYADLLSGIDKLLRVPLAEPAKEMSHV